MRNAFASIVQARPCPTFGRPVRLWDSSLDYGPAVLRMPFGFHLTVDTLPSADFITGQRGITPAFGYGTPHPSARGTLTLLISALPSAHYGPLRPCAPLRYSQLLRVLPLVFSLSIASKVPAVPHKSLIQDHATHAGRTRPVSRFPWALPGRVKGPPF